MGNNARFLNHSCNPNSELQVWRVNNEYRVGVFSIRKIKKNEEITIDYSFDSFSEEPWECHCGENNCKYNIFI